MHIKRLCTVPGTSCRYHSWSLRWAGFLKWKMVFFLNFDTHWRGDTHGSASVRHRLFCVRVLLPALVHTHQWLSLPGSMAGDLVLDSTQQLGAWLTLPPPTHTHTHTHTRTRTHTHTTHTTHTHTHPPPHTHPHADLSRQLDHPCIAL